MNDNLKQMSEFLIEIGADDVKHSHKGYLAHCIGVRNELKKWGADDDLCKAAVFHSIYGTERFQQFTLPLENRKRLQEMIGEKAERLAYLNCAMIRSDFDRSIFQTSGPYIVKDRFAGEDIELSPEEFDELCALHLCDWLEQLPRDFEWEYRRGAYRQMAVRLGGSALEAFDRVFALEAAGSGH